jgi:hypothetical protein
VAAAVQDDGGAEDGSLVPKDVTPVIAPTVYIWMGLLIVGAGVAITRAAHPLAALGLVLAVTAAVVVTPQFLTGFAELWFDKRVERRWREGEGEQRRRTWAKRQSIVFRRARGILVACIGAAGCVYTLAFVTTVVLRHAHVGYRAWLETTIVAVAYVGAAGMVFGLLILLVLSASAAAWVSYLGREDESYRYISAAMLAERFIKDPRTKLLAVVLFLVGNGLQFVDAMRG